MKNFNSIKNSLLLIACFVFLTNSALAVNTVQVKAVVSVSYESKDFFSSKPPKGTEARAIKLAKTTAWKKYISGFGEAKRVSYDIVKNSILNSLGYLKIAPEPSLNVGFEYDLKALIIFLITRTSV